jgi:RNA polymerase sigma-70 factor, ECF subfamily
VLESPTPVDDALQTAYLKAYRAFPPSSRNHLEAWLTQIVYRSCLDMIRSTRRHPTIPLGSDEDAAAWAGRTDATSPMAIDLAAAFRRLPVEARAAVVLVDVLGFDYQAAAEILDTRRGTIASRLHTARAQLREHLSGYNEELTTDEPSG